MKTIAGRSWLSWTTVAVLAGLCGFLALLQNHWIVAVSRAERERLTQQLQNELNHLAREFNTEITSAAAALMPSQPEIDGLGREQAYAVRYTQWKQSHDRMFSRIALAVPHDDSLDLLVFNMNTSQFAPADWPADWSPVREELLARLNHRLFGMLMQEPRTVITLPRFGGTRRAEQEWLVLELNLDHVRDTMLPELLRRYLAAGGNSLDYQALVTDYADPSKVIYESAPNQSETVRDSPDASVALFNIDVGQVARQRPPGGFPPGPPPGDRGHRMGHPRPGLPGSPEPLGQPGFMGPGRWRLLVRHHAGSLEAVVARARWQNLATSLGVLLLILATVAALVRFSRRAQQLADLQMNFVAGVSHELRTPLTVIRTAAFNLRGKRAANPDQVERYGALIQEESEKLTALVEQILQFAGARAGHAIRAREPVAIDTVIEDGLRSSGAAGSAFIVEKQVEPGLPLVLADQLAMKYAMQNLVENAMKYGTEGSNWIGIFASSATEENGAAVEVRVADHGPGIPVDEQEHIFDPFFRGRRAVQDQVHGTGLGLNLVKKIIEAHGGTIRVKSEPMKGTEFVLRLPAAPPEPA